MRATHCLFSFLAVGLSALGADPMQPLFDEAREGNPTLASARATGAGAVFRADSVDALPEPQVTGGVFLVPVETRVGPQEWKIGVSQSFPWPGTLAAKRAAAEAEAGGLLLGEDTVWREIVLGLRTVVLELNYLDRATGVTQTNLQLMRRLELVAQARFKAGAPMTGVTQAQIEEGQLDEELQGLADRRRPWLARLNALTGRSREAPHPSYPRALELPPPADEAILFQRLHRNHPSLLGLVTTIRAAGERRTLARREQYPSLMVGVEYISTGKAEMPGVDDSGRDPVIAMAGLRLPLWRGKNESRVAAATALVGAAQARLQSRRQELEVDLEASLAAWREADRKAKLVAESLIPLAEQSLHVVETAYRNGAESFSSLIDTERTLLELRLSLARARTDRSLAAAQIESLTAIAPGEPR